MRYESSPSHTPITSLSWSPWGNFVVCSSPRDNSLLLWDIPLGVGTCIRRGSRGGVASVAWSPDGRRVFAGSVSALFHVWETKKWTCERWQNFKGRCKVRCDHRAYMGNQIWLDPQKSVNFLGAQVTSCFSSSSCLPLISRQAVGVAVEKCCSLLSKETPHCIISVFMET